MKRKIIILITVIVFVSISYIFDRCSHAVVDDLYNYETQSETIIEETTKALRKRYPMEENPGNIFPDKYSEDKKFLEYVEKYGGEQYRKYMNDPKALMYEMCKKNGNWVIYPINDNVYNDYNEKNGLLGDIEYDSIELVNKQLKFNGSYGDSVYDPAEILITQGNKKTKYYIKYNAFDVLINNIEVYTSYDSFITDENGNLLDTRQPITDLDVIEKIVDKYDGVVGLSEKFKKEHLNFNGLVDVKSITKTDSNESEKGYIIYMHYDISDFDSGIVYFEIDYYITNENHEYRLDFKLDEKGFLDEAKVTLLK